MCKGLSIYDDIQDVLNLICEIKDEDFRKNPKYLKDLYLYAKNLKVKTKKSLIKNKN